MSSRTRFTTQEFTVIFVFLCSLSGKDRVIFVTKEDHETPSNAELIADDPDDPYEEQG